MNKIFQIVLVFFVFVSCQRTDVNNIIQEAGNSEFIAAADISGYPEILESNPMFYDLEGSRKDFLNILKENGINTIRLRLWVNPSDEHSGFNEVNQFSQTLKNQGFKIWITLHYSDTWADPSSQKLPHQWEGLNFTELQDSVYSYTAMVLKELQPDFIQIGNEINNGFLHPHGHISNDFQQFKDLITTAITAIRSNSNNTEIILHFAGVQDADWFFDQVNILDFDIMGLSYYPIWHGKSLDMLESTMQQLSTSYQKKIIIAETAYPFTLDWNDMTNNIVGLEQQLILPEYPATRMGQKNFVKNIRTIMNRLEKGVGFCYWGGELIAWKGTQSKDASPWENQALFDFSNSALPVLRAFKNE